MCREAGARVATNVFVLDLDLGEFNGLDGRRLEVIADGLTLWWGAQLAVDTTLVSLLHSDGTAIRRAAAHDDTALERHGTAIRRAAAHDDTALEAARKRKERVYPELSGDGGRARLVVLAAEVGGRWSNETAGFLCALAKARAETVPFLMQSRAEAAWLRRWSAMLACNAARAFSMSLLEQRPAVVTGAVPSVQEVLRDDGFA